MRVWQAWLPSINLIYIRLESETKHVLTAEEDNYTSCALAVIRGKSPPATRHHMQRSISTFSASLHISSSSRGMACHSSGEPAGVRPGAEQRKAELWPFKPLFPCKSWLPASCVSNFQRRIWDHPFSLLTLGSLAWTHILGHMDPTFNRR